MVYNSSFTSASRKTRNEQKTFKTFLYLNFFKCMLELFIPLKEEMFQQQSKLIFVQNQETKNRPKVFTKKKKFVASLLKRCFRINKIKK